MMQRSLVQAVILIAVAFVLAMVSNAVASRDRRLVLPGYYPGATQVPAEVQKPVVVPVRPEPPPPMPVAVAVPEPSTTKSPETAGRRPAIEARKPTPRPVETTREFSPHPDKPYIEVTGDEAAQLHSRGALTLDARRTSVYEQGHIAGARSFSVWESDVDEKVNKLYEERSDPREQLKPILVYCSGGDCEDSHMLAQKLWGVQFNNVYVYKDGFPDWQKRGGAIHTGSNP